MSEIRSKAATWAYRQGHQRVFGFARPWYARAWRRALVWLSWQITRARLSLRGIR